MDLKGLFGFENKNVVITGAGSGMGKEAARLLAELGANVYATVRSKPLDFEVAKEIKTDFSRPEAAMEVADQVPSEIEALFICHGISDKPGRPVREECFGESVSGLLERKSRRAGGDGTSAGGVGEQDLQLCERPGDLY